MINTSVRPCPPAPAMPPFARSAATFKLSASGNSTEPDPEPVPEPKPDPEPAAARGGRTRPGNAPEPDVWSDTAVGRGREGKSGTWQDGH